MKTLIALVLAVFAFLYSEFALAGYAQLKPPVGWSQGLGAAFPGQAGVFNFGSAANGSTFKGTTVLTNAALNVAGQLVTVPVSMRLAANAASVAATFSFGNPLLFLGVLAGSVIYDHYKSNGLEVRNGLWVKKIPGCSAGVCFEYRFSENDSWNPLGSAQAIFKSRFLSNNPPGNYGGADYAIRFISSPTSFENVAWESTRKYPTGPLEVIGSGDMAPYKRVLPASDPLFTPVGDVEFHSIADPLPLPLGSPQELPIPLPVQQPVFNPDPAYSPLSNPASRPLWVPTGNPVKNPNPLINPDGSPVSNPQPDTWTQPGVRVTPSPTPTDPWRVDLTPEDKTKTDSSPNVDDAPVTTTPTEPIPEKGLCELFPDILACAKLGTPGTPETVKNTDKPMTITKDAGWGPENGSCPAPRVINLHFGSVQLPWTSICGLASGMRPFFVAFAYLGAALSFFGIGRKA